MELNKDYVDKAEEVIMSISIPQGNGKRKFKLTTSKIRNILAMVTEIYNDVIHEKGEKLSDEMIERIQYLRLRIVYEAGRDKDVKEFVDKSGILNDVKKIGNSKKKFLDFCKYVEALVAYHRFYGGRDN
jgi:CRISPR-associated protein Csm2